MDLNTQIDASGYVDSLCSMKVTQFSKSFFFQQRVGFFNVMAVNFSPGLAPNPLTAHVPSILSMPSSRQAASPHHWYDLFSGLW